MSESYLDHLAKVFGARTKGPWHALASMHPSVVPEHRITGVHSDECKIYHVKLDPICIKETHEMQVATARFIALSANIADEMLEVVRAAEALIEDSSFMPPGCSPDQECLSQAIAALRAKVKAINPGA